MYEVSKLVKGWKNFTRKNNATELLRTLCNGDKQLKDYLKMINQLPLVFEQGIEAPDFIFDGCIEYLSEGMTEVPFTEVRVHEKAIPQECHRVSLLIRLLNPTYMHFIGFAMVDASIVDDWHLHSWCVDPEGVIIEGTPLIRDRYFGKEVPFDRELHVRLFDGSQQELLIEAQQLMTAELRSVKELCVV